jgi:hypothetical protein
MGAYDGEGEISNSIPFKTACNGQITERGRITWEGRDALKFISFFLLVTADSRVLEVNTQRLGPSRALEPLCDTAIFMKEKATSYTEAHRK